MALSLHVTFIVTLYSNDITEHFNISFRMSRCFEIGSQLGAGDFSIYSFSSTCIISKYFGAMPFKIGLNVQNKIKAIISSKLSLKDVFSYLLARVLLHQPTSALTIFLFQRDSYFQMLFGQLHQPITFNTFEI